MNRFANRKCGGIILALALAELLIVALVFTIGGTVPRALVALPLVLALPGCAVTLALFPGRALGWAERALLGLGLSLAIAALGGLLLHLTPWGLQPVSWVVLLEAITLAAGAIGLLRGRGAGAVAAPIRTSGGLTVAQAMLFALAALVLSGALALTVRGAQEQETVGFTQLWMVRASPTNQSQARLGVSNREPASTRFQLQLVVDGQVRQAWTLQLAHDETWEMTVDLPADLAPTADVEGVLYRGDAPDNVYRRVKLGREP